MAFPFPRIVLHADDLGMSRAISEGIVRGFRQGLLTSASLLANAPDASRALSQWKELAAELAEGRLPSADVRRTLGDPDCPFDVGVHLNLTQGRPLGGDRYPAELLDAEGRLPGVFSLFTRLHRSGGKFRDALRDECSRQIQFLCDHGLRPTHLNGHQYIEMIAGRGGNRAPTDATVRHQCGACGLRALAVGHSDPLRVPHPEMAARLGQIPFRRQIPKLRRRAWHRASRCVLRRRSRRRHRSAAASFVPGKRSRLPAY